MKVKFESKNTNRNMMGNDHEVEFHVIEIQLFQEVEFVQ
jgi:hypothetical protein